MQEEEGEGWKVIITLCFHIPACKKKFEEKEVQIEKQEILRRDGTSPRSAGQRYAFFIHLYIFLSGSFGPANGIGCQFHGYFVLYTDLSFKENLRDGDGEEGERI